MFIYVHNVAPLLLQLHEKCSSWVSLTLNLMGCVPLLRMMFLPKFNYVFRNCPIWLSGAFLQEMNQCVSQFIWNGTLTRLARSTLHMPVQTGGLALPIFQVYYWAAVLVMVRWWFAQLLDNAEMFLKDACLGPLSELSNLVLVAQNISWLPRPTKTTLTDSFHFLGIGLQINLPNRLVFW